MVIEFDPNDGGPKSLEEITAEIAEAVYHCDTKQIRESLMEFAEEIKRQAVEP